MVTDEMVTDDTGMLPDEMVTEELVSDNMVTEEMVPDDKVKDEMVPASCGILMLKRRPISQ